MVSSEVAPFAKTGGLADVAAAVTRFLGREGHDVRLLMPFYECIRAGDWKIEPDPRLAGIDVPMGEQTFRCSISRVALPDSDVEVLLLDCPQLYGRDRLYGYDSDEYLRFGVLSRAAPVLCQWMEWAPDIIHLNDWHTALTSLYLKAEQGWDELFAKTKTLLTLHNIAYQGVFPESVLGELGLEQHRELLHQDDLEQGQINFLKTGILYADALTTVSETYAREIQTPDFGMGLQEMLKARSDSLFGIINGVDYGEWSPETDELIAQKYSAADLEGKVANKRALLEAFDLAYDERAPLLGIVTRLAAQKGLELLMEVLPVVLKESDARLVVLGSGDEKYEKYFQWLRDAFPEQAGFYRGYHNELAHQIEAGADVFLMPSRYEPCGLNQMYSLRYGTVPVVRRTGGLADTVEPFDAATGKGTGFVFDEFSGQALLDSIREALVVWKDRAAWKQLVQNGMARDFSWDRQGKHYLELYRRLIGAGG